MRHRHSGFAAAVWFAGLCVTLGVGGCDELTAVTESDLSMVITAVLQTFLTFGADFGRQALAAFLF